RRGPRDLRRLRPRGARGPLLRGLRPPARHAHRAPLRALRRRPPTERPLLLRLRRARELTMDTTAPDGSLLPARVELDEASGPVSPRFQYTLRIVAATDGGPP